MTGDKHRDAVLSALRGCARPVTVQQISEAMGGGAPSDSSLYTTMGRLLELGLVKRREETVLIGRQELKRVTWALSEPPAAGTPGSES